MKWTKPPYNAWKKRFAYFPTYVGEDEDGNRIIVWWEYYERREVSDTTSDYFEYRPIPCSETFQTRSYYRSFY